MPLSNATATTAAVKPLSTRAYPASCYGHWKLTGDGGSGVATDSSGNGRHLVPGSSLVAADVWETRAGRATMPGKEGGDSDDYSLISADTYDNPDWTRTALLVSFWMKQAEAATAAITTAVCAGGRAAMPGWRVDISATGGVLFDVYAGGSEAYISGSIGDVDDDADHCIQVLWDGMLELVTVWIDGEEKPTVTATGASAALNADPIVTGIALGNVKPINNAAPGEFWDYWVFHFDGGTPDNISNIVKQLRTQRFTPPRGVS